MRTILKLSYIYYKLIKAKRAKKYTNWKKYYKNCIKKIKLKNYRRTNALK